MFLRGKKCVVILLALTIALISPQIMASGDFMHDTVGCEYQESHSSVDSSINPACSERSDCINHYGQSNLFVSTASTGQYPSVKIYLPAVIDSAQYAAQFPDQIDHPPKPLLS